MNYKLLSVIICYFMENLWFCDVNSVFICVLSESFKRICPVQGAVIPASAKGEVKSLWDEPNVFLKTKVHIWQAKLLNWLLPTNYYVN